MTVADRAWRFPEMLNTLIKEGGYTRNRQPILDDVRISGAALSQYARGATTPSVTKLLALAAFFDVSLDYLVHGTPNFGVTTAQGDVVRHVQDAFGEVQARAAAHTALVARLGRLLADGIDEAAGKAAAETTVEGLVGDDELLRLEVRAVRADVVTIDLDANVLALGDGGTTAGAFLDAVAVALQRGCSYRFVVSSRPRTADTSITAFRDLLTDKVGPNLVAQQCPIRRATVPTVLGMGLYQLDLDVLHNEDPALHAQFQRDVDEDGWFGYLIRPQPAANRDSIMNSRRRDTARHWFETLWTTGEDV